MVDCVDEEGEAEDIGEEDEFLSVLSAFASSRDRLSISTYMSNIARYLPNFHQEIQSRHPFCCA